MSDVTTQPNALALISQGMDWDIVTMDGDVMTIAAGASIVDFIPSSGNFTPRLPQLKIGQASDSEILNGEVAGVAGNPRMEPRFYIKRRLRTEGSDQDDSAAKYEYLGPFDGPLTAVPIGITKAPNRTYFANKFTPGQNASPDCHSENFLQPDARFAGQTIPGTDIVAGPCATMKIKTDKNGQAVVDPKTGKPIIYTVDVCPLAIGHRDEQTGKWIPSPCTEQWVIGVAVLWEGEWVLVESYYKSTSRTEGKKVVKALRDLELAGVPLWTRNVVLTAIKSGAGNSFVPKLVAGTEWSPEEEDQFAALTERWAQALEARAKSAESVPTAENDDQPNAPAVAPADQPANEGMVITTNATKPSGGKKPKADPMF